MKPAQAQTLATACERVVKEQRNLTAREVYEVLAKDTHLAREVPVTLPTVSRSLRSLVKSKHVRLVRKDNTAHYVHGNFGPRLESNGVHDVQDA